MVEVNEADNIISHAELHGAPEFGSLDFLKLEAEVALGIKVLKQRPSQIDPETFKAVRLATRLMEMAADKIQGQAIVDIDAHTPPENRQEEIALADAQELHEVANKWEAFALQSKPYLDSVQIAFGQGQQRSGRGI